jgi:expansin (peptidoglycan-binding protein)
LAVALLAAACGSDADGKKGDVGSDPPTTSAATFDDVHEGVYHLGPVDFAESEYHNACAPEGGYRGDLYMSTGLGGEFLAGVSNELSQGGGICDACILIETAEGESIVARLVTYGVEHAPGDIDVSPSVYDAINHGENPRTMTWRFAHCSEAGKLAYEFKTGSNPFWTALWVRNPGVPLTKVEVKGTGDNDFVELARESDGSLVDASGFGDGAFTLRITGLDGQVVEDELPGFDAGQLVQSKKQFD